VAGRLLASYLVVLAAFAITLGWSVRALSAAAADGALLRSAFVPLLSSIGEALANQNLITTQLNHVTAAENPADIKLWLETMQRVRPLTLERIEADAANGLADHGRAELKRRVVATTERVEQLVEGQSQRYEALFMAVAESDRARAEKLREELLAHEVQAAQALRQLRLDVDRELTALTNEAQSRERRSQVLLIGLSVLTLLVMLMTSVYARRVLAPLGTVTNRARAVARGDLTPRDVVATDDELGELALSFEEMVAAIVRTRRELLQAERLATIGKMAAHITHEVRNPLSSISLNLELLEDELSAGAATRAVDLGDAPESQQLLAAVRAEVERLATISEQYLAAAREPKLQLAEENLGDLVQDVLAFLQPELERAKLVSELEVSQALPLVQVDESQLRQALINLVRNAREATGEGGIIRVAALGVGAQIEVVVEDEGAGVPQEERIAIFEPFFTTKERGTGLGLALTRAIVEAHGAEIRCEEGSRGGARFVISIPV